MFMSRAKSHTKLLFSQQTGCEWHSFCPIPRTSIGEQVIPLWRRVISYCIDKIHFCIKARTQELQRLESPRREDQEGCQQRCRRTAISSEKWDTRMHSNRAHPLKRVAALKIRPIALVSRNTGWSARLVPQYFVSFCKCWGKYRSY